MTVPAQASRIPGDFSTPASTAVDPNPVIAELQPAGPPPKARRILKPKKPKPNDRGTGSIALPRSGASLGAGRAWPLMAWTATDGGLYAGRIMPRLRVAEASAGVMIAAARSDKAR